MLCLCVISIMFIKSMFSVGSVYVGGYGSLSECGICVFRELYPVGFLVVGKSPSLLL